MRKPLPILFSVIGCLCVFIVSLWCVDAFLGVSILGTLNLGLRDAVEASLPPPPDYQPPEGEGKPQDEQPVPEDRIPGAEDRYSFPVELYPYRAMLDTASQSVYDQAYANAAGLYDSFPLHTPISPEALQRVVDALRGDHPELFWLGNSYEYSHNDAGLVLSLKLNYNETVLDIAAARNAFDSAARQVLREARGLGSAVEMEKFVFDYLVENVDYQASAPLNQSAYSALVNEQTVCAGYARAFQYLMQQLGVPCYLSTGSADGGPHAWNIIELDGDFYNVDVTWDDPIGNTAGLRFYDYFNLTDQVMDEDHSREELSVSLPACEGTAYSYANVFGATDDDSRIATMRE